MPINQNSVKATVFKFLKTNGYKPTMLDSSGKEMAITDDADVFQFNFIKDGENYGTITIGIDGTGELTLYFGDDVAGSPAGSTDDGMLSFHELTARLRKLTFGKVSKFDLSDIENLKYDMAKRENTKKLDEGYYPMGKSGSYSDAVPTVKMVIKHTRKIEEGEQRYRNIAQIFIENSLGERVLAPTTKPGLARPFARHIAEGGLPNDERWNHIREMCEDYTKMAGFVRATKNGQFNESTQQLVTEGTEHYLQLRESLRKMAGKRGYNEHFDNWSPTLIEDAAGADLSEMFMNATLDPRIESAMPILSKISRGRTSMNEVAEISELSEWADQLVSERLAPKSMPQLDDLAGMLSDEIVVGPNAMNAKAMLASVNLEDDELNGLLEELSEQDPDADAVETIINWMEQSDDHRMHSVIDKIERPTTPEVAESLRPGERHHYEDDPETGERVYKGIRGDQYQSPKKPHQFPDDSQARAQRQYDRQEPKEGVAEGADEGLSKYSTERLQAYVKKVSGGGVPAFGSGAKLKRVQAELKRREQGVAEGLRGTGNPGMPTPYDQGRADAKKGRPYDNPYDQPGEEQEHRNYRKGYEQGKQQGVAEAGSFSYGKPPRKGSVADLAAKKRKEQERGQQPVEPRDQRVGVARVRKDLAEGVMDQIKNIYMMLVSDTPMGTTKSEFLGHWQRIIQDELGKRIDIDTLAKLDDNFTNRYKSMSRRGDVGDWHREMGHDLEEGVEEGVAEDLEANQQRVGQLGPKAKHAKPGDLVGVDESTDSLAAMRRLSGLLK